MKGDTRDDANIKMPYSIWSAKQIMSSPKSADPTVSKLYLELCLDASSIYDSPLPSGLLVVKIIECHLPAPLTQDNQPNEPDSVPSPVIGVL